MILLYRLLHTYRTDETYLSKLPEKLSNVELFALQN